MTGLRFDIDSNYGLTRRVPPLLDLLDKYGLRATFFCVMGTDPSIPEIVRLRLRAKKTEKPAGSGPHAVGLKWRQLRKILYTLLRPRRVGSGHEDLLRQIAARGHEVYPHGWSHIQWQRNLDRIDAQEHLDLCIRSHREIFGIAPAGFASPGRVVNETALGAFDTMGFQFSGDLDGKAPFYPEGRACMQIPVTWFVTIDELRGGGLADGEIAEALAGHVLEREFSVLYEHPDNIYGAELAVLDRFYSIITEKGVEVCTFSEIFNRYREIAPRKSAPHV